MRTKKEKKKTKKNKDEIEVIWLEDDENEKKIITKKNIFLITLLLGILYITVFVDLLTCFICHNKPILVHLCDYCDRDGHITILEGIPLLYLILFYILRYS